MQIQSDSDWLFHYDFCFEKKKKKAYVQHFLVWGAEYFILFPSSDKLINNLFWGIVPIFWSPIQILS